MLSGNCPELSHEKVKMSHEKLILPQIQSQKLIYLLADFLEINPLHTKTNFPAERVFKADSYL